MKVPLLNFAGGPGVPLLNFEGGPGVPLSHHASESFNRSSHPEMFLKNLFRKFSQNSLEKTCGGSLIFIKLNNAVEAPTKKKETKRNFIKKLGLLLNFDYTSNIWNFKNWNAAEILKYVIGLRSDIEMKLREIVKKQSPRGVL